METKPIVSTIPVKQIKGKRVASTLRDHLNVLLALCTITVASGLGQMAAGGTVVSAAAILLIVYLPYFIFNKQRNYHFLTDDGVYFVKNGTAAHVTWDLITSARVIHKSVWSYIGFKVNREIPASLLPAKEKEYRFRQESEVTACFCRHMRVEGLSRR